MKKILFSLILISLVYYSNAQVGIGTEKPNSTLTIEGSLETGYKEVTTSTYAISNNDYYITYNGTGVGTFSFPAVGTGTESFTGRIYKIKNITPNNLILNANGSDKFRNDSNIGVSSLTLLPGQYVELVNNTNSAGNGTWDVSSINMPAPSATNWQFDNIYDYTATNPQDILPNTIAGKAGDLLKNFNQAIIIPANKEAKVVISYSIPMGASDDSLIPKYVGGSSPSVSLSGGYYGVQLFKDGVELPAGSRKSTVISRNANAAYSMTTVSASVADTFTSVSTERVITYSLHHYKEAVPGSVRYLMYAASGDNYNWGKGYWSITVYLK